MSDARQTLEAGAGERTPAEVCSLLIELSRLLKAQRFYPPNHPGRKEVVDRAWRAWSGDLARRGGLELELRQGDFRFVGSREPIGRGALDDLAREFVHRAVRRVRFEGDFDLEAFTALVDVLATDPDELMASGGVERALYDRVQRGVTLNQVDYAAALERAAPEPAEGDADAAPEAEQTTGIDPLAALAGLLEQERDEEAQGESTPPSEVRRSADLLASLRELDDCRDDARYAQLIPRVTSEAGALADEGRPDEAYRAMLVLGSHVGDNDRSERQRGLALEGLTQLASGERLDDLARRACAEAAGSSVRASQLLLQLGAHAVPRLLDALLDDDDPDRRGQIGGILITMGEKAVGRVIAALKADDYGRARAAARLTGQLQHPAAVPALRGLLRGSGVPGDTRKEAAKALVRIGNRTALDTLIEALSSSQPEVPAIAAFCLGATGTKRALEALVSTLRRAVRGHDLELARETIRALGRLGRPEAAPELAGILAQRALFRRRRLRELQLAAATALGRVPGDAARRALERAASRGDVQVRRAARGSLERRPRERPAP